MGRRQEWELGGQTLRRLLSVCSVPAAGDPGVRKALDLFPGTE